MNWLGKVFTKKKKSYSTNNEYKLLIIDDSKDLLHEIFGISQERVEYLLKACLKAYDDNEQLHSCLEQVVLECNHTNEVVMTTLMMQKVIDKKQSMHRVGDMFKNLFGNG
jgi:hypothetical protein